MERKLLGVYESENAIVRIYAGPMSDTPEKLQALVVEAAIKFAKAIRRSNPELFNSISSSDTKDEK